MTQNAQTAESATMFSSFNDMVTAPELAQMLKVGRNNAYELVRAGIVPSVRIGRQIRISKQAVLDYIARAEGRLN